MNGKHLWVCAAALLAAQGICQAGPYPLMGKEPAAPASAPSSQDAASKTDKPSDLRPLLKGVIRAGEEDGGEGTIRWNAGVIEEGKQSHVEHTFTLKNTLKRAVTVSRLRGSCGCETLFLTKAGKPVARIALAPGDTAQVRVSVALRFGQSGEMHKYAWAYGPDESARPLGAMEIVMIVRAPVAFEPDVLDFGALPLGSSKSVAVTVTADADALAGKPVPTPVASTPSVTVTPDGPETAALRDGTAARSRRFQVTLLPFLDAGPVSATLSFVGPEALKGASVTLVGTISGTLTAQPKSVFFGSIPTGQGVSREVRLSEPAAERGRKLSLSSDSRWLTARLGEAAGPGRLLVITLMPGAPSGLVQTQIIVSTASGEHLSIPVVGEVLGHFGAAPSLQKSSAPQK